MRADVESSLPDVALVERSQRVSDGRGGWSEGWTTEFEVRARLTSASSVETSRELGLVAVTRPLLVVPAETDIRTTDRVTVAGQTFHVTGVRDTGSFEVARYVELAEVA